MILPRRILGRRTLCIVFLVLVVPTFAFWSSSKPTPPPAPSKNPEPPKTSEVAILTWQSSIKNVESSKREGSACSTSAFVFGGRTSSQTWTDDFLRLDLESLQFTTLSPSVRPPARSDSSLLTMQNGRALYLFGGRSSSFGYLSDLWKYDTISAEWAKIQPASPASMTPQPRQKHVTFPHFDSQSLFVFGGSNFDSASSSLQRLNDLHLFNATTLTWTRISTSTTFQNSSEWPPALEGSAVAIAPNKSTVFLFGGINDKKQYSSSVWAFDMLPSFKWRKLDAQMSGGARAFFSIAQMGKLAFLSGGLSNPSSSSSSSASSPASGASSSSALNSVSVFDLEAGIFVETITRNHQSYAATLSRQSHCSISVEHKQEIVIFGGSAHPSQPAQYKDILQLRAPLLLPTVTTTQSPTTLPSSHGQTNSSSTGSIVPSSVPTAGSAVSMMAAIEDLLSAAMDELKAHEESEAKKNAQPQEANEEGRTEAQEVATTVNVQQVQDQLKRWKSVETALSIAMELQAESEEAEGKWKERRQVTAVKRREVEATRQRHAEAAAAFRQVTEELQKAAADHANATTVLMNTEDALVKRRAHVAEQLKKKQDATSVYETVKKEEDLLETRVQKQKSEVVEVLKKSLDASKKELESLATQQEQVIASKLSQLNIQEAEEQATHKSTAGELKSQAHERDNLMDRIAEEKEVLEMISEAESQSQEASKLMNALFRMLRSIEKRRKQELAERIVPVSSHSSGDAADMDAATPTALLAKYKEESTLSLKSLTESVTVQNVTLAKREAELSAIKNRLQSIAQEKTALLLQQKQVQEQMAALRKQIGELESKYALESGVLEKMEREELSRVKSAVQAAESQLKSLQSQEESEKLSSYSMMALEANVVKAAEEEQRAIERAQKQRQLVGQRLTEMRSTRNAVSEAEAALAVAIASEKETMAPAQQAKQKVYEAHVQLEMRLKEATLQHYVM